MTDIAVPKGAFPEARSLFEQPYSIRAEDQDFTPPAEVRAKPRPEEQFSFDVRGHSLNRVVDASASLIALTMRITDLAALDDIDTLHRRAAVEIESIELELHRLGYDRISILAHRYCLCAVIDEAAMNSRWGNDSNWSERSLLATFHNETWGGEKYFVILERLMMEPQRYIDLLEFLYLCLNLGYEGKYRAMHNGRVQLESVVKELHDLIRSTRGLADELQLFRPENVVDKAHAVAWQTPLSLVLGLAFVAALGFYITYFVLADADASRAIAEIGQIVGK